MNRRRASAINRKSLIHEVRDKLAPTYRRRLTMASNTVGRRHPEKGALSQKHGASFATLDYRDGDLRHTCERKRWRSFLSWLRALLTWPGVLRPFPLQDSLGGSSQTNDGLDKPVQPALYIPYPRFMWMGTQFLVRTQGSPLVSLHDIQRAILSVNSDQQTEFDVRDLNQRIEQQPEFKQQRLFSIFFGLFSTLALALALVGLYSVITYSVAQHQ